MFSRDRIRVYVINSLVSKNYIESSGRKKKIIVRSAQWSFLAFGLLGLIYLLYKKNIRRSDFSAPSTEPGHRRGM